MAPKKNQKKKHKPLPLVEARRSSLEPETKNTLWAVGFIVISIFLGISFFGKAGIVGRGIYKAFDYLLGYGYFLVPLLFVILAITLIKQERPPIRPLRALFGTLFLLSGLGLIEILAQSRGGLLGKLLAKPTLMLFDTVGGIVVLTAFVLSSLIVLFEMRFHWIRNNLKKTEEELVSSAETEEYDEEDYETDEDSQGSALPLKAPLVDALAKEVQAKSPAPRELKLTGLLGKKNEDDEFVGDFNTMNNDEGTYTPPPLSLLQKDKGKPGVGDIKANANIIKRTLQNFGIEVEMDEVSIGPTVTRYALKPAEGVRLSKIVGLQNNLELALAAHPVRIEAPIPGQSLVGIEVPNSSKTMVGLGGLLSTKDFNNPTKPLLIALGKGISGQAFYADLAKMPHVLIAGATGSGKSVTIHALVNSLIFKNSPQQLKFVMVDPKRVELTLYNGIPHLLTPVITQAKKAILALKWAGKEMDRRYDILEMHKVRDISSYHANILPKLLEEADPGIPVERLPYIVVIIDELADLMQAYPRELESGIVRLAQMSRAVGIHLMISTQRPSVNVITGLIKANVPARVALQVSSQIDSRTILDTIGAEKLLGQGDMLYLSGEMSKPSRVQSAFISEKEVKEVVKHLKNFSTNDAPHEIDISDTDTNSRTLYDMDLDAEEDFDGDDDALYEEAKEIVIHAGKASTSYIQRKLRVGYARAARLVDLMEEKGVVGPAQGSRPRDVLIGGGGEGHRDDVHENEQPNF